MRNIVCATDLGDDPAEEIDQAVEITARTGAKLTIVHVLAPPVVVPTTGVEVPPPVVDMDELEAQARAALDRRLTSRNLASASREVIRGSGSITSEILRRADELNADLVVMGSHRHSTLERVLLGSTAKDVVRHAHRPVLVARQRARRGPVVVATDLTLHALPALRAAVEEARGRGAPLVVLHCLDLPTPVLALGGAVVPAEPDDPRSPQAQRRAAEERLRELLRQAEVQAQPMVAEGPPAPTIVAFAEESGAQLVVTGTSSKSGLKRVLLGSVAEKVVTKAPCPVLTVPARSD